MTYTVHLPDSKYLLIPAAKSIFLRDIWAVDTDDGATIIVLCSRCSTYPTIHKSYDPDVYESRCPCDSRSVFAPDLAEFAQVDLEAVAGFLYMQYFQINENAAVQDMFLTWLAVQTGIDNNKLSIKLS